MTTPNYKQYGFDIRDVGVTIDKTDPKKSMITVKTQDYLTMEDYIALMSTNSTWSDALPNEYETDVDDAINNGYKIYVHAANPYTIFNIEGVKVGEPKLLNSKSDWFDVLKSNHMDIHSAVSSAFRKSSDATVTHYISSFSPVFNAAFTVSHQLAGSSVKKSSVVSAVSSKGMTIRAPPESKLAGFNASAGKYGSFPATYPYGGTKEFDYCLLGRYENRYMQKIGTGVIIFGAPNSAAIAASKTTYGMPSYKGVQTIGFEASGLSKVLKSEESSTSALVPVSSTSTPVDDVLSGDYYTPMTGQCYILEIGKLYTWASLYLSKLYFTQQTLCKKIEQIRPLPPTNIKYNFNNEIVFRINEEFALKLAQHSASLGEKIDEIFNITGTDFIPSSTGGVKFSDLLQGPNSFYVYSIATNCYKIPVTSDILQQLGYFQCNPGSIDVLYKRISDYVYLALYTLLAVSDYNLQTSSETEVLIEIMEVPTCLNIPRIEELKDFKIRYMVTDTDEIMMYYTSLAAIEAGNVMQDNANGFLYNLRDDKFLFNTCTFKTFDVSTYASNSIFMLLAASMHASPVKQIDFALSTTAIVDKNNKTGYDSLNTSHHSQAHINLLPFIVFQQYMPFGPEQRVRVLDDENRQDETRHDVYTAALQSILPKMISSSGSMKDEAEANMKFYMAVVTTNGVARPHFDQILNTLTLRYSFTFQDHIKHMLLVLGGRASLIPPECVNDYVCLVNFLKITMATFYLWSDWSTLMYLAGVTGNMISVSGLDTIMTSAVTSGVFVNNKQDRTFVSKINDYTEANKFATRQFNQMVRETMKKESDKYARQTSDPRVDAKNSNTTSSKTIDTETDTLTTNAYEYVHKWTSVDKITPSSLYVAMNPGEVIQSNGDQGATVFRSVQQIYFSFNSSPEAAIDLLSLLSVLMMDFKIPKVGIQAYKQEETFCAVTFCAYYNHIVPKVEYLYMRYGGELEYSSGSRSGFKPRVAQDAPTERKRYVNLMSFLSITVCNVFFALYIKRDDNKKKLFDRFTCESVHQQDLILRKRDPMLKLTVTPFEGWETLFCVPNSVLQPGRTDVMLHVESMQAVVQEQFSLWNTIVKNSQFPLGEISKCIGLPKTFSSIDVINTGYLVTSYAYDAKCEDVYQVLDERMSNGCISDTQLGNLMIMCSKGLNFLLNRPFLQDLFRMSFLIYSTMNEISALTTLGPNIDLISQGLNGLFIFYYEQILTGLRAKMTSSNSSELEKEEYLLLYTFFAPFKHFGPLNMPSLVGFYAYACTSLSKNFENLYPTIIGSRNDIFLQLQSSGLISQTLDIYDVMYNCEIFQNVMRRAIYFSHYHTFKYYIENFHGTQPGKEMEPVVLIPIDMLMRMFQTEPYFNVTSKNTPITTYPSAKDSTKDIGNAGTMINIENMEFLSRVWRDVQHDITTLSLSVPLPLLLESELQLKGFYKDNRLVNYKYEKILMGIPTCIQEIYGHVVHCAYSTYPLIHHALYSKLQTQLLVPPDGIIPADVVYGNFNANEHYKAVLASMADVDRIMKDELSSDLYILGIYENLKDGSSALLNGLKRPNAKAAIDQKSHFDKFVSQQFGLIKKMDHSDTGLQVAGHKDLSTAAAKMNSLMDRIASATTDYTTIQSDASLSAEQKQKKTIDLLASNLSTIKEVVKSIGLSPDTSAVSGINATLGALLAGGGVGAGKLTDLQSRVFNVSGDDLQRVATTAVQSLREAYATYYQKMYTLVASLPISADERTSIGQAMVGFIRSGSPTDIVISQLNDYIIHSTTARPGLLQAMRNYDGFENPYSYSGVVKALENAINTHLSLTSTSAVSENNLVTLSVGVVSSLQLTLDPHTVAMDLIRVYKGNAAANVSHVREIRESIDSLLSSTHQSRTTNAHENRINQLAATFKPHLPAQYGQRSSASDAREAIASLGGLSSYLNVRAANQNTLLYNQLPAEVAELQRIQNALHAHEINSFGKLAALHGNSVFLS